MIHHLRVLFIAIFSIALSGEARGACAHGFGVNRLTSLSDAVGTASFAYDERGNQLSQIRVINGVALATTTSYDAASRVSGMGYPSGTVVGYAHDLAGQVTSVMATLPGASSATSIASGITYKPFGPLTGLTYGNGLAGVRTYDLSYRVATLNVGRLQQQGYGYDAADRVMTLTDGANSANNQSFGYDTLDHLNAATGAYGSFTWQYDAGGNQKTQSLGGVSTTYGYMPNSNVLISETTGGAITAVGTSAAGNTTTVTPASGSAVVRGYNQAERLANVTVGGTQTAGYVYDAFGRRASKVLAKSGSVYLYDVTGHMLEEAAQTTGALVTDNIFLNGAPVAQVTPSALFFIHPDRLGTPQLATTTQGAVAWRGVFQPFGVNTGNKGILVQKLRFPGQYADAETGDNQNGFRDYDPSLGRYLETDPIGIAGGLNGFAYVGSDPVNAVDPLGLSTVTYNGSANTITVTTNDGNSQSFPAYNNTDSRSQGPIPDGTYNYIEHVIHPDDSPNSPYGSNGGFKFDVPNRTNIEVHSGRQSIPDGRGRTGPQHATMGCIRTNDAGTDAINSAAQNGDPPTTLTVSH